MGNELKKRVSPIKQMRLTYGLLPTIDEFG